MSERKTQGIAEIIESLKRSPELGKLFETSRIWREWQTVAGPKLMPHGRPVGIRDDTLFIEVESPVWMHRFSYHKRNMIYRINGLLNRFAVSEIFFVLNPEDDPAELQDGV